MKSEYEVVIVGGGPAGLSAALVLGRARRSVLVIDNGRPRNERAKLLHGFLTRDGIPPQELLKLGRDQLLPYPSVEIVSDTVIEVTKNSQRFTVTLGNETTIIGKRVLLATGIQDALPKIEGMEEFYGRGVYHCPYCDGWEVRDKSLIAFGHGESAAKLAFSLTVWSKKVSVIFDGDSKPQKRERELLKKLKIEVFHQPLKSLHGHQHLEKLTLADGKEIACDALFFVGPEYQKSGLGEKLGCEFDENGGIKTNQWEATCVPGLFAAGNALKEVQLAIVAAARGATAAFGINSSLLQDDLNIQCERF